MAKGNAAAVGAGNQRGTSVTPTRTSPRNATFRAMMERGKQLGRTAKSRATEQILGLNASTPAARGGVAVINKAKAERMKRFKEAKRTLEEKKRKEAAKK